MKSSIKSMEARYTKAINAKVGDTIVCPACGTHFIKTNYQSKFCKTKGKTKCKDYYWGDFS